MSAHREQLKALQDKLEKVRKIIQLALISDGGAFLPSEIKERAAMNARMVISQKIGEMHRESILNIESPDRKP